MINQEFHRYQESTKPSENKMFLRRRDALYQKIFAKVLK